MSTIILNQETAQLTALQLLKVGAVQLRPANPFTWTSGLKSPIYCDNRLTLSFPSLRTYIKQQLADLIKQHYPHAEVIAGVATAGIPQGALLADILGLPFIYVRSSPKGHGMENLIEGRLEGQANVVVVEDLISTGGSSVKAAQALKKAGANVMAVVSVFTYGFVESAEAFAEQNIKYHSLTDFATLIKVAAEKDYIADDKLETLQAWSANPAEWGNQTA